MIIAYHLPYNSCQDFGTLLVTGYLQGSPLSVNSLVHIPGLGNFQMSHIKASEDPYLIEYPTEKRRLEHRRNCEMEDEREPTILQIADPKKQVFMYMFIILIMLSAVNFINEKLFLDGIV